MIETSSRLEARIGALISAYADRAPMAVDPAAIARSAASANDRARVAWVGSPGRSLAFVLLVAGLVVTIVAGSLAVGANLFHRTPDDVLTRRGFVEPFIGLAPEGAPASTPESGELVFSFYGRVGSIGDLHRTSLYADGRLIWVRNLDWKTDPDPARGAVAEAKARAEFGRAEPTAAVIEQRLTPAGVELLRSEVMATARLVARYRSDEDITAYSPGVLWGGMTVTVANERFVAAWSDPALPERLANPTSWLPTDAWVDSRIAGYVPARYAYCYYSSVDPARALAALPVSARELLASATTVATGGGDGPDCRYRLSPDSARAVAAAFDEAGLAKERGARSIGYRITEPGRSDGAWFTVFLLPVLPNGDVVCECG